MGHLRWVLFILFVLSVGYDGLMAYENNNEDEEICDQELAHITVVNYGNKFYVFCLEIDENNRIKGFRYNAYNEDTHEFIKSKAYGDKDFGVNNCEYPGLGETNEIFLANRDTQLPLNSTDRAELSRRVLGIQDPIDTNSDDCISNQTIDLGSKYGVRALYFQTSYFNFYQGGDFYFTYRPHSFGGSYERLGLRLSRHNDEWRLSDINNEKVTALEVEMYRPWFSVRIPLGIQSIRLYVEENMIYEEEVEGEVMVENR